MCFCHCFPADSEDGRGNGKGSKKGDGTAENEHLSDAVTGNVANLLYASTVVIVGSRGIVAKTSATDLVLGVDSEVTLDASASADLDHGIGELQVKNKITLLNMFYHCNLIVHFHNLLRVRFFC
jgi:hypothetical protein